MIIFVRVLLRLYKNKDYTSTVKLAAKFLCNRRLNQPQSQPIFNFLGDRVAIAFLILYLLIIFLARAMVFNLSTCLVTELYSFSLSSDF